MTPQLQNALLKARNDLRETAPLIHCITNPIAINDCANGILAVGGKPIMAEHPDEVEEITCIAGALGVNIGNITDARRTSVLTSAKAAKTAGVPVSFDAVGVTCSALRRDLTHTLLREACPEILKSNDAEIRAIAGALKAPVSASPSASEVESSSLALTPSVFLSSSLTELLPMSITASKLF